MMETVASRFLRYVQVDTMSVETCPDCPSSPGQMTFARQMADELKALGLEDARCDEHGYVYATLPAKGDHPARVGLIAHMDTVDAVPGPVHPQVIHDYDGEDITLKNGVVIPAEDAIKALKGHDLIVTDGESVLGADDKAGVAEIMALVERLLQPDAPEHCTLCIGFTPDEEIGRGADLFDVPGFGAEYAYTVDGGGLGDVEFENFNAASARIVFTGVNIHPGSAKNRMKNAALMAMQWASLMPAAETPAHTEGYEGFYHLCEIKGDEEHAELIYILRDHDAGKLEAKIAFLNKTAEYMNHIWGEGSAEVQVRHSYQNMKEVLKPHMAVVDQAYAAYSAMGLNPTSVPIRGGTDGARLSFMGLPCPNLSTGGYNGHSRKELASVNQMEAMVDVLQYIAEHAVPLAK